jgi:hypothetical protein
LLFFNPANTQYKPHPRISGTIPVRINKIRSFSHGLKKMAAIKGMSIDKTIPNRMGIDIELIDNFCFDVFFFSDLKSLGKIRMPTMITTSVSISVIEAKKILI